MPGWFAFRSHMLARRTILGIACCAVAPVALGVPYVLVPDATNNVITGFNQSNGNMIAVEGKLPGEWLVLGDFIDSGTISLVRHAAQVGSQIWISDQMSGIVHRFSAQFEMPRYLGSFNLANPRGIATIGGEAWIASGGVGTAGGIARYSFNGDPLGVIEAEDPFDVEPLGSGFLTANIIQSRIELFSAAGVFQNVWSGPSALDFPLQIIRRTAQSGEEIVVVGNSDPSPGLFRYSAADGSFLGRTLTIAILPFITISQPRGVAELGTGELLWSGTQGVFAVNPNSGSSRVLYTGENFVCNMADTVDFTKYCQGDLNNDAFVDDADFTMFATAYNDLLCTTVNGSFPAGCPADLNSDGFVDDSDFTYFAKAYDTLLCPLSP